MKSKRKVSRTLHYSPAVSREGEMIDRTVFMASTWEPLIPVKSPKKQPILTESRRSVETRKLQDRKILNHVLLANKILIWAFPALPSSTHPRFQFYYWKRHISEVQLPAWGSHRSQTQEHESLHAQWNQPWSSECPVPAAAHGNWNSLSWSSQEDC